MQWRYFGVDLWRLEHSSLARHIAGNFAVAHSLVAGSFVAVHSWVADSPAAVQSLVADSLPAGRSPVRIAARTQLAVHSPAAAHSLVAGSPPAGRSPVRSAGRNQRSPVHIAGRTVDRYRGRLVVEGCTHHTDSADLDLVDSP